MIGPSHHFFSRRCLLSPATTYRQGPLEVQGGKMRLLGLALALKHHLGSEAGLDHSH